MYLEERTIHLQLCLNISFGNRVSKTLVGGEFLFKVDANPQVSRNASTTYTVKRLTTDANIITSFKNNPVTNKNLPSAMVTPLSCASNPVGCVVDVQQTMVSQAVTYDTSKGKKRLMTWAD